ncbi:MAG: hypothetical protein IK035_01905 [Firmicutes bacterium]|nr:hypothetical protein [Bacillota bacterium]
MGAVVGDLGYLSLFLLAGLALRELVTPLQKLFLPAGLIGGVLALVMGPQVLGWIEIPKTFGGMAGPMIDIVLTCMILGTTLNRDRLRSFAGSTTIVALTYFAQMAVGTITGVVLSNFWPAMPKGWGVMAVYTYWGGHGAATAAGKLFESLGEAENGMLAIGIILATLGLIVAIVAGMVLVNWSVRKGYATNLERGEKGEIKTQRGPIPVEKQKSLGSATVASDALNGLALQLALVLVSIWVGRQIVAYLKPYVPIAKSFPSFFYGMLGAFIIWTLMGCLKIQGYVDKKSVNTISGLALEICICSATATLNVKLLASYMAPILIHMVVIVAMMAFICMVIVKRWLKKDWLETGLLFFGQGTGSAPSGMALGRCVDPELRNTQAWEGFGVASALMGVVGSFLVAFMPVLTVQSVWFPIGIGAAVSVALFIFGEKFVRGK